MPSVKLVFENEIRRAAIGEDGQHLRFDELINIVLELFPNLRGSTFYFQWVDDEGDVVSISLERELQEAVRVSAQTGKLLRLTIATHEENPDSHPSCTNQYSTITAEHIGVSCDECNMSPIKGIRYKCTVREDFDLCEACEAKRLQPYPMIKITDPSQAPRVLVYGLNDQDGRGGRGGRGLWRRGLRSFDHHPAPHAGHMPPPPFAHPRGPHHHGRHGNHPRACGPPRNAGSFTNGHGSLESCIDANLDKFSKTLQKGLSHLKGANLSNPISPFVAAMDALFGDKNEEDAKDAPEAKPSECSYADVAVDEAEADDLLEQAIQESLLDSTKPIHVPTAPSAVPNLPKPALRYVRDVTFPDNTVVQPGTTFMKIWRVRNDGQHPWPQDAQLVPAGGDLLTEENQFAELPVVGPDEESEIGLMLTAPRANGLYTAYFRAQTKEGQHFGHRLWASIIVADGEPDWQVLSASASESTSSFADGAPKEENATEKVTEDVEVESVDGEDMLEASVHMTSSKATTDEDRQKKSLAMLWRRELEILNDMGFHDLDIILPLLQTHLSAPVSLSTDKNGTPRMEGMQQVVASLLTQDLQEV